MKSLTARIIADIAIFFMIFLVPWWLSVIIGVFALFYFDAYVEVILFGFMMDCLYGSRTGLGAYLFTVLSFCLFMLQIFITEKMRV